MPLKFSVSSDVYPVEAEVPGGFGGSAGGLSVEPRGRLYPGASAVSLWSPRGPDGLALPLLINLKLLLTARLISLRCSCSRRPPSNHPGLRS